jgi:6-phosphogluconolactonase
MLNITEFASREALVEASASALADALHAGIAERGRAYAALSGGSTPEPVYRRLAAMPLDWLRITFTLVDERFIALADPASNEGMLERTLAPAFAAGAQFKPLFFATETVQQAADCAEVLFTPPLAFDIALMGMGDDGHTASWFPQSNDLSEALTAQRSVIAVHAPGATGSADRITLTRTALARARRTLLLITGEQKRTVLQSAAERNLPVDALFGASMPPVEIYWAL